MVVLVIFIVLVLIATGVLVVKFLLPGKKADTKATTTPTIVAETVETVPTEEVTEQTTVPCTSLYAPAVDTLTEAGQMYRLNASASPDNTTDTITYASEDENVVTVDENGNLTAVGNGSTNIVVTCGEQQIKCAVTVAIEETEPTTEETEAPTEETEETKKSSSGDVTLKLKRSDITFSRLGVYYTLQLDCDLSAEDVTWRTSNSAIANVNNGVVTAMGRGIAEIDRQVWRPGGQLHRPLQVLKRKEFPSRTGWIAGARFSILAIPLKIRYNVTKLVLRKGDKHYGIPLRYPAPDRWQGPGPSGPGPPGLR